MLSRAGAVIRRRITSIHGASVGLYVLLVVYVFPPQSSPRAQNFFTVVTLRQRGSRTWQKQQQADVDVCRGGEL